MADGVAQYLHERPAAVDMLPILDMLAAWVIAQIDIVKMSLGAGVQRRGDLGGVADITKFVMAARAAVGAMKSDHRRALMQVGGRPFAALVKKMAGFETAER